MITEVKYPDYRTYVESRVQVNDAMTALLAGARLAAHTLGLTEGSKLTLSQIFPGVEHIKRFDQPSDKARALLEQADTHVAAVSLPYALATHEEFVMQMISTLRQQKVPITDQGRPVKAWNMHDVLFSSCSYASPDSVLKSFHVIREMRNCVIHQGGAVGQNLHDALTAMTKESRSDWELLTGGRSPETAVQGGKLILAAEHIFLSFAITKKLGREINAALAAALNSPYWAEVAVKDFELGTTAPHNSSKWRRALTGYARRWYLAAGLTDSDLEAAARGLGYWTAAQWELQS